MRIIKLLDARGVESFHQVLRSSSSVQFDPRPDWFLLATPIGVPLGQADLEWIHSTDERIAWDRTFSLAD